MLRFWVKTYLCVHNMVYQAVKIVWILLSVDHGEEIHAGCVRLTLLRKRNKDISE